MRFARLRRLALARLGDRLSTHTPGRFVLRDYAAERLGLSQYGGYDMWAGLELGTVIVQETFSFRYVGRVISWDDTRIVLEDAVMVLYDGGHAEFANGNPLDLAEIEKTHSPLYLPIDWCGAWGPYKGGKIPKPQ